MMLCPKCGKELSDEFAFCPFCSEKIVSDEAVNDDEKETSALVMDIICDDSADQDYLPAASPANETEEETVSENGTEAVDDTATANEEEPQPEVQGESADNKIADSSQPSQKQQKKKRGGLIAGVIAAVIILAVVVFVSVQAMRQSKYDNGIEMLAAGNYKEALEIFESLGSFNDSSEKLEHAKHGVNYQDAKELMEQGEYEKAGEMLNDVDKELFPDADELIYECKQMPKYNSAVAELENGKYFSAYKAFTALGSYKDSSEKAKACIVKKPSTGVTYRNKNYSGSACSLKISPPSDGSYTYFKIYDKEGKELIASVFINKGETYTISLPAGSYIFNAAYGYDNWFGEKDMFGDKGVYQRLKNGSTSDVFTLKKNYAYTLRLRTAEKTEGTPVPTQKIDKDSF